MDVNLALLALLLMPAVVVLSWSYVQEQRAARRYEQKLREHFKQVAQLETKLRGINEANGFRLYYFDPPAKPKRKAAQNDDGEIVYIDAECEEPTLNIHDIGEH